MVQRVLSRRNKLTIVFFALLQLIAFGFLANYFQLNSLAQRSLDRLFNVPQNIFAQIFEEYREFESERAFRLEKEIKDLEDTIYEKDLEIESLQNQKDLSLLLLYRRLNKKLMFRGLGILIMSAAANIEFLLNSIKNEKIKFLLYHKEILLLEKVGERFLMNLR